MASAKEELTIVTPIGDWESEYLREEVDVSSEEAVEAPSFVGPVSTPDDEPDEIEPFVKLADQKAAERALGYLARAIPVHIWSRLLIVAAHGGDIVAAAQIVHDKIDEIVERLMEPQSV